MPMRRSRSWPFYVRTAAIIFLLVILAVYQDINPFHYTPLGSGSSSKLHADILNTTLGFQKIFVLNLQSRTDRRDALTLAAALSNIQLDWIDGVSGDDVLEKALPPGERIGLSSGGRGSWRAHMNAIQTIVAENLGSALILEDDIDWDIRLKSQLQTFALASRSLLSENVRRRNSFDASKKILQDLEHDQTKEHRKVSFPLNSLASTPSPKVSPYGDGWDMAWIGHCGTFFRNISPTSRILIQNDATVPEPHHLKPHPFALPDYYGPMYPPHTRIVHHPAGASCTLAYALTQTGARKLLYEFGVKAFDKQIDFMLGDFCDNVEDINGTRGGIGRAESEAVCVTVQPPLFSHHYPEGGSSNIYATGGGMVTMVGTLYVRWSVRMNMARLIKGVKDFVDQWPDKQV